MPEPKLLHELRLYWRRGSDGAPFSFAERLNSVIELFDVDMPVIAFHGGQQTCQHHGGIGRPVSVMTAMQLPLGTVYRDVDGLNATRAENNGLLAALVDRAIAN